MLSFFREVAAGDNMALRPSESNSEVKANGFVATMGSEGQGNFSSLEPEASF